MSRSDKRDWLIVLALLVMAVFSLVSQQQAYDSAEKWTDTLAPFRAHGVRVER